MLSSELAFQINLKFNAAGNLPSVMWVPLKTLWKGGRGGISCVVFYLKPAAMCYNSRKEKLCIKTDLSQTTEFLGLISTAFKQIVDILLEGKTAI